jgi:hypothetical protein
MKRKRTEEAIAMLPEGFADQILCDLGVEELVDEILSQPMPEFDGLSSMELLDAEVDLCMYVGVTAQRIQNEAFAFLGRHGANLPRKRDGEITRQRPVLLRGDKTLPKKEPHFAANQCRDELHMKYVQVHFSDLKLNAHLVEDALQNRLLYYPPPGRPAVAGGGQGPNGEGQAARKGRGVTKFS